MRESQQQTSVSRQHHAAKQPQNIAKNAATSFHPLLQLQAEIGNRAVNHLIGQQQQRVTQQPIQAKPSFRGLSGELSANLPSTPTGGKELPEQVQQKMETAFGEDFSDVRIHEGSQAESIGAVAYTQGNHIHFQPGKYDPTTTAGQQLLGHELTHVVQQRTGQVGVSQGSSTSINLDPALEGEADSMGAKAAQGKLASVTGAAKDSQSSPNQGATNVVQCDLTEEQKVALKGLGLTPGNFARFEQMGRVLHGKREDQDLTTEELSDENLIRTFQTQLRTKFAGLLDLDSRATEGMKLGLREANLLDLSIMADVMRQTGDRNLVDFLQGGQFRISDKQEDAQRILYNQWASMPQAKERISSHYRGYTTTGYSSDVATQKHYGINSPFLHHTLFGAASPKGEQPNGPNEFTFIQTENTPFSADASRREKIGHSLDAAEYVFTGWNIGPHGTSTHTDYKPINLTPNPDTRPEPSIPLYRRPFGQNVMSALSYVQPLGRVGVYGTRAGRTGLGYLGTGASYVGSGLSTGASYLGSGLSTGAEVASNVWESLFGEEEDWEPHFDEDFPFFM